MFNYLILQFVFQFYLFGLLNGFCDCPQCPPCAVQDFCPAPVICQPKICPAIPACPMPRSCPVCIKPIVKSLQIPVIKRIYKVIDKPVVINKCCKTCIEQCIVRKKRNIPNDTVITVNSVCNNKFLGKIIAKTMTTDPTTSQELILKRVGRSLGEYNIFCSTGNLTYVAYTNDFCQVAKDDITCYIFKNL